MLTKLWKRVLAIFEKLRDVPLLLLRANMGVLFFSTGWGKVHHVDKVTKYFEKLHIPAPHLNAVVVGWTELVGGALLVVGLASRVSAFALATTMIVALATAILPGIGPDLKESGESGPLAYFVALNGKEETTYLLILIAIVILGPGKIALDRLVEKRRQKEG